MAVDDGAFTRRQATAPLAAIVWSSPDDLEGVALGRLRVDGNDATDQIVALVRSTRQFEGIRVVLLDGITMGGFNVVDLDRVSRELDRPVVAVTPHPPDFDRIRAALKKHFPRDAASRWRRLRRHPLFRVRIGEGTVLAAAVGCTPSEATVVLHRTARRGHWPEPLRLAHMIAHAVGARPSSRPLRSGRTLKVRSRVPKRGPVA